MQYFGMNYGQDISNEIQNKLTVNLVEPVHAPGVIARHIIRERMTRTGQANIHTARETQKIILEAAVTAGIYDTALYEVGNFGEHDCAGLIRSKCGRSHCYE